MLFWRRVERTGELRIVARVRVLALAERHGTLTYTAPGLTPDTVLFTIRAGTRDVAAFARSAVTAVHGTLTLGWSAREQA